VIQDDDIEPHLHNRCSFGSVILFLRSRIGHAGY